MKQVRERQLPYDFIHVWNLRNKTRRRKQKTRLLNIKNKLVVIRGEAGEGMGEMEDGEKEQRGFMLLDFKDTVTNVVQGKRH